MPCTRPTDKTDAERTYLNPTARVPTPCVVAPCLLYTGSCVAKPGKTVVPNATVVECYLTGVGDICCLLIDADCQQRAMEKLATIDFSFTQ